MDSSMWHEYCVSADPVEPELLALRQWRKLTDSERRTRARQLSRWLARMYLRTPELDKIDAWLTELVNDNNDGSLGAKQIAAIDGVNFAGKSTFLMRWGRGFYVSSVADAETDRRGRPVSHTVPGIEEDISPLVWTNLPSRSKQVSVDSTNLNYFDLSIDGRGIEVTFRAIKTLKRHGARVVIMDDIHFLKTARAADAQEVKDHIKHVATEIGNFGATLVIAGANLGDVDLVADPQIRGRLESRTIPIYAAESEAEQRQWQVIIRDYETALLPHLPAGKPGMLFTKLAGELAYRTQGYLGDLRTLVRKAAVAATLDGSHAIRRAHIDAVTLGDRAEADKTISPTHASRPKSTPMKGAKSSGSQRLSKSAVRARKATPRRGQPSHLRVVDP